MKKDHAFKSEITVRPENPSGSDYAEYVTANHPVTFIGRSVDGYIWYEFKVRSGSGYQVWRGSFGPGAFGDMALTMMAANPQAAIKAFGTAMQQFEISSSVT